MPYSVCFIIQEPTTDDKNNQNQQNELLRRHSIHLTFPQRMLNSRFLCWKHITNGLSQRLIKPVDVKTISRERTDQLLRLPQKRNKAARFFY